MMKLGDNGPELGTNLTLQEIFVSFCAEKSSALKTVPNLTDEGRGKWQSMKYLHFFISLK